MIKSCLRKQPSIGVFIKKCSENIQQIYRRTPMPKLVCNFIEIAFRHGCSHVNLLHNFRTLFPKKTSEGLLLSVRSTSLIAVTWKSVFNRFAKWHILIIEAVGRKCSLKKVFLIILQYSQGKINPVLKSLFSKVAGLQTCNFIKKRL